MTPSRHPIGVDIEGTKIAAGSVDVSNDSVNNRIEIPTRSERGGAALFQSVRDMIVSLVAAPGGMSHGIGVGICEIADGDGKLRCAVTVDWRSRDLNELGGGGEVVHLVPDVRAAALAEASFGVARDHKHALYVSVGTGIASVPVFEGVPYGGANGAALVLATAPRSIVCRHCGSPSQGPLEDIASGRAIARHHSRGRSGDAREVLLAAANGDAAAAELIFRATALLGDAIGRLANCLDPQAIILGSAAGAYWDHLQRQLRLLPLIAACIEPFCKPASLSDPSTSKKSRYKRADGRASRAACSTGLHHHRGHDPWFLCTQSRCPLGTCAGPDRMM